MKASIYSLFFILATAGLSAAASINISFTGISNDANLIDADESSVVGLPVAETHTGVSPA